VHAPSENFAYVPACWVYQTVRYVWRPGYWCGFRPGWVWTPSCYRWTPGGFIFVSGSASLYRIPLTNTTTATSIGGLFTTAAQRERSISVSPNGTLYVATRDRGTGSATSGAVLLERLLPGDTSVGGRRVLVGADARNPSVVAGPGDSVGIVVFTTSEFQVSATVQPY